MTRRSQSLILATVSAALLAFGAASSAQRGAGGRGGLDHKARQGRPVKLGISGGNANDLANGFCCSGTLGALVEKNGTQYVLSNTHVLAHDSVASAADPDVAAAGDPVNQPGLIDVQCQNISADYVAHLSDWAGLAPSGVAGVDAAIAEVIPGAVDATGAILEIGAISSSTASAFPGQKVKKSGRTTGLTRTTVDSINATVTVGYDRECNGSDFTTTFTGQVLVKNRGSKFLAGGDSGSLMVEDVTESARAIGLLFAGSSTIGVANPIGAVLNRFGVSLVGVTTAPAQTDQALTTSRPDVARALRTQERHSRRLSSLPGGVGHAVGVEASGAVIKVLMETISPQDRRRIPAQLDGVPVVVEEVGRIVALGASSTQVAR